MDTCIVFGAAEGFPETFQKQKEDLIIAADAGIKACERFGIEPDLAVGDFDSLGKTPACREVIRHPVRKDDTDSMLAVKTGWERGYRRFLLYGCAGGRLDHTFANYQTLAYLAKRGGLGFVCANGYTVSAFSKATAMFSEKAQGTISLFALGDQSTVSASGLLYPLNKTVLTPDFPLGQSNEFLR
ncbi:MAG: thiamine diphosphokinase, partial [Clostridia bacterium]|nr:thiamine diphosphokinase [Clostridia bacterium]